MPRELACESSLRATSLKIMNYSGLAAIEDFDSFRKAGMLIDGDCWLHLST